MPRAVDTYALLRARVLDVVNRWDPEGLLAMDSPEDEYTPEARSFAALLDRGVTITPEIVRQVWEEWFGPDSGFVRLASREVRATFADELNRAALPGGQRAQPWRRTPLGRTAAHGAAAPGGLKSGDPAGRGRSRPGPG